jgi:hypothetical protein
MLYNQMEAAGYSPRPHQALTMFINGLPITIVSYINLYGHVMISLNESYDSLLPNIHYLFDHIIRLNGNINQSQVSTHEHCTQPIN